MLKKIKIPLMILGILIYTSGVFYVGARTGNILGHARNDNGVTWGALPLDANGNLKVAVQ